MYSFNGAELRLCRTVRMPFIPCSDKRDLTFREPCPRHDQSLSFPWGTGRNAPPTRSSREIGRIRQLVGGHPTLSSGAYCLLLPTTAYSGPRLRLRVSSRCS